MRKRRRRLGATAIQCVCWQVLDGSGDPRALPVLAQAYDALQTRAARLDDPAVRESFLSRVPPNRDLVAAWAATR